MIEEEGDFLIGKIEWILSNTISVQHPSISGPTLSVTRFDHTTTSVWSLGKNMQIQENNDPIQTLNNSNVSITHLNFIHTTSGGFGINPESVSVSFTMQATTSDGHVLTRDFSTLRYLSK